MSIILAGGGEAADSLPLDQALVWLSNAGPMLYLPMAMEPDRYAGCETWIRSVFEPLGVRSITMWTDLADHQPSELSNFASIYIGGGNTYRLLDNIRRAGFDHALVDYAKTGVIYGGSAGAILLGSTIDTAAHADANLVGVQNTAGLNLVAGRAVWCHYGPKEDSALRTFVGRATGPTIVLTERAGVLVDGDSLRSIGYDQAFVMDPNQERKPIMPIPQPGTTAPSFNLASSTGETVDSAKLKDKTFVLYFYPKADTPGCTTETCGFRDALAGYQKLGVPVFGISPDPVKDVTKFGQKFNVNFPLLADVDHAIAEKYGVWGEKQMYGKTYMGVHRTTFVIKNGQIAQVFEKVKPEGHDQQVLEWLRANG